MFTELSNGKNSHILAKVLPNNSLGKYIPEVKQTNCTIILDTPEDDFSVVILPINIPRAINNIEIGIDIKIANIILIENSKPNIIARIKNKISCTKMIGIKDKIYPKIKSLDFIGLTPSLIKRDVDLSLAISVDVNKVIKEKPNTIIPGVKFSNLYESFGILNC